VAINAAIPAPTPQQPPSQQLPRADHRDRRHQHNAQQQNLELRQGRDASDDTQCE
jgi:hypothetical protein